MIAASSEVIDVVSCSRGEGERGEYCAETRIEDGREPDNNIGTTDEGESRRVGDFGEFEG